MLILNKEDLCCLHCVKDEFIQWVFADKYNILFSFTEICVLGKKQSSYHWSGKMALLVCNIPNLRGKWASYEIGYLKETSIKLLWPRKPGLICNPRKVFYKI